MKSIIEVKNEETILSNNSKNTLKSNRSKGSVTSNKSKQDNCIFVINAEFLRHRDYVLSDSNEVWKIVSGSKSYYF